MNKSRKLVKQMIFLFVGLIALVICYSPLNKYFLRGVGPDLAAQFYALFPFLG